MAPAARSSKDSDADEKKLDDATDPLAFSADHVQHNLRVTYYCRTFLSIIAGVIAGIMGLTGIYGFLCYFIVMFFASVGLAAKAKFNTSAYFDSWHRVAFDGVLQGLMSFVLFWTLVYDIVHIF